MRMDPRFERTELTLRKTFIQLMAEYGYGTITATKVIQAAKVNRTTFYAHHQDKDDLLEALEADLLNGILEIAQTLPGKIFLHDEQIINSPEIINQITPVFAYLRSNGRFLSLLLDPIKGDRGFASKLTDTIRASWSKNHIIDRLEVPEDYALSVMTGIMGSMIGEWVQRNFRESPDEFASIALRIVSALSHELIHQSEEYRSLKGDGDS